MAANPLRRITEQEKAAYRRDGAVMLRNVLSREWVNAIAEALEDFAENRGDFDVDYEIEGRAHVKGGQLTSLFREKARHVVVKSPAAAIAGETAGCTYLRYFYDTILYRPAGKVTPTPWHQDTPYWNVAGHDLVRIWIPVDPVPEEVSLEMVRGSHLWNITYRPTGFAEHGLKEKQIGSYTFEAEWDPNLPPVPDIESHRDSFDILRWGAEPGDALVLHGNILHAAPGSEAEYGQRRVYPMVFAGDDITYYRRPGNTNPDLATISGYDLQTGDSLEKAEAVHPVVWRAA